MFNMCRANREAGKELVVEVTVRKRCVLTRGGVLDCDSRCS